MRQELLEWVSTFPPAEEADPAAFASSPVADLVKRRIPDAIRAALPETERMIIKGSIGSGRWTDTSWVALLDPGVTTTVQEEYYVVYLLSADCQRLYLTLAQGCTVLQRESGILRAQAELKHRMAVMWSRARSITPRLGPLQLNLGSRSWRGRLYEAGVVAGIPYATNTLPVEEVLVADLRATLALYRQVRSAGGWRADDEIVAEAQDDLGIDDLEHAKRYRLHRSIERQRSHADKVKRVLGTRCMGCELKLSEVYGEIADGMIEAHHLTPLASLTEGKIARFNPRTDFAVLCPNCHRVIHRMPDPSNLAALRSVRRR